jgi:hypothetical protein
MTEIGTISGMTITLDSVTMPMVTIGNHPFPMYQIEQTMLLMQNCAIPIGMDRGCYDTDLPSVLLADALCKQGLLWKKTIGNPACTYYQITDEDKWFDFREDLAVLGEAFDYEIHVG